MATAILDVVIGNSSGRNGVTLLRGTLGGSFQAAISAAPLFRQRIAAADLNGDGKMILCSAESSAFGVLLGHGDGTFGPIQEYTVSTSTPSFAIGDINGTGGPTSSWRPPTAKFAVRLNAGDGTFGPPVFVGQGQTGGAILLGDFNRDNRLDVHVSGSGLAQLFLGNGDGTFVSSPLSVPNGILRGF